MPRITSGIDFWINEIYTFVKCSEGKTASFEDFSPGSLWRFVYFGKERTLTINTFPWNEILMVTFPETECTFSSALRWVGYIRLNEAE